jgi:hypothetical protein
MAQFPPFGRPTSQNPVRTHGFIISAAETLVVAAGALALSISAPPATISSTAPSTPVVYQRPVSQYGIRAWGPPSVSATPDVFNQSVSAGAPGVTVTAPTATSVPSTITHQPGPNIVVVVAPQATPLSGAVSLPGGSQALSISAPQAAITGNATSVPVYVRRAVSQYGLRWFGQASPSTTPETTFAQTVALEPNSVAVSAPDAARAAVVSLAVGGSTVSISAPIATLVVPTPGASGNPILLRPRQVLRGRFTVKRPYVETFGAIDEVAPATLTAAANPVAVSVSAQPAVLQAGSVSLSAGSSALAVSAPPVTVSGGAGFLSLNQQNLAISAPPATVLVGATTVVLQPCVVALSAPDIVANRTVSAGSVAIAVTAPPAAVSQAAVRQAGSQAIAISAPPMTVTVTPVTRAAGAQTIVVEAPEVSRQAEVLIASAQAAVGISAPDVTVLVSGTTVQAGPVTVALHLGSPNVIGATALPTDSFEGTVESRLPTNTLHSRLSIRTLVFRG